MSVENEDSLLQLVYVSAATVDFGDTELDELLGCARRHNATLDITGVLLFSDGTFFQVLEGKPDDVRGLYEKIQGDARHNNVLVLAERSIDERNFGEWSMGFVRDEQLIRELPGFIDFFSDQGRTFLDLQGDEQRVQQILEGFRRGRWRRQPVSH